MIEAKPTDKARAVPAKELKNFFQSSRRSVLFLYVSTKNQTNAAAATIKKISCNKNPTRLWIGFNLLSRPINRVGRVRGQQRIVKLGNASGASRCSAHTEV